MLGTGTLLYCYKINKNINIILIHFLGCQNALSLLATLTTYLCNRINFAIVDFISFLSTILSINPCSNKNSALWNPSGNFCLMVCSMTLGPANPISAFGSAKIISPKLAKLAVTPPVVGSVKIDR